MICGAIPGQVAAITMAFNITDEEMPEAVVSESDEQTHICLYRCKGELRTIETKITIFSSNSIKIQLEQKLGGTVYTQGFQFHKGTIRTKPWVQTL